MSGAASGISAVLTAPLRIEAVLDMVAVLEGLVDGSFEMLVVEPDPAVFEALRLSYPNMPLHAVAGNVAEAIARAERDVVLLARGDGELDVYDLNHFFDAIER